MAKKKSNNLYLTLPERNDNVNVEEDITHNMEILDKQVNDITKSLKGKVDATSPNFEGIPTTPDVKEPANGKQIVNVNYINKILNVEEI